MNTRTLRCAFLFTGLLAGSAFAQDAPAPPAAGSAAATAKAPTAQQQKMKDCSADAKSKSLKGADRKAFMKTCLSSKATDTGAAAAKP